MAAFEFIEEDWACYANWWYDNKYLWHDATNREITTSYGLFGATTSTSGQAVKHHVGRCREGDDPLRTEESEYLAVTNLSTNQTQVLANYKVSGALAGDPPTFTTTRTDPYFTSPPIRPSLGGEPYDTIFGDLAAIADLFDEPAFAAVPLAGSGLGTGGSGLGTGPAGLATASTPPPTLPAALQAQSPRAAGPLDSRTTPVNTESAGEAESEPGEPKLRAFARRGADWEFAHNADDALNVFDAVAEETFRQWVAPYQAILQLSLEHLQNLEQVARAIQQDPRIVKAMLADLPKLPKHVAEQVRTGAELLGSNDPVQRNQGALILGGVLYTIWDWRRLAKGIPHGQWIPERTNGWSPRAKAYQHQITGRPAGMAYDVGGVRFDGHNGVSLLEAKGPGYARLLEQGWAKERLLDQAKRQVQAAKGAPITWHVAEKEAADAIRALLRREGININVVFTPPIP